MSANAATTILGSSWVMRQLRSVIARIAPTHIPVLIQGPTGAGKELVAVALHSLSGRRGAFVAFNVCAHPEALFEDALFGHVRGAFTSAIGESVGYVAQADCGSLFLDEIGGLDLSLQVKLLRTIETGIYRQVGGSRDRRSDFRVVAAANEPIKDLVNGGRFRSDLAHRIAGVVIDVPPLRERLEDVPELALHFLTCSTQRRVGSRFTRSALRALQGYHWPGNVRELRQVVDRAIVLARSESIRERDVQVAMANGVTRAVVHDNAARELVEALKKCAWDTARTASHLGVHRSTIYRRMHRLGLPRRLQ